MEFRNAILLLQALIFLAVSFVVLGAPMKKSSIPYLSSSNSDCYNDDIGEMRDEVNELWRDVQKNKEVIAAEFAAEDNKICIPIQYDLNCPTAYKETKFVVWTKFNVSKDYGNAIIYFISMDNKVPVIPGFAWSEACTLNYFSNNTISSEKVATINVTVPEGLCGEGDVLSSAIKCIATLMPMYAVQLENGITTEVSKPVGYAEIHATIEQNYESILTKYNAIIVCIIILFAFSIIGVLYFIIEESIHVTKHGKPRMYFHFWSAVFLTFGGFVYFACSTSFSDSQPLLVIAVALFAVIIYPTALVSLSYHRFKRTYDKIYIKLFTVPFTAVVPSTLGKFAWQFIMTTFGLYFTAVFICYILYISTNIVLMYYFYPLRTLIRGFYVFGAIFYTILVGAFVLYMFEKSTEILKLFVYAITHKCVKVNLPPWNVHRLIARTKEDHDNHKNYYLKELQDNVIKYGATGGTLLMWLSLVKFFLLVFFFFVYIRAVIWLGELLFERTVYITSNIDSLLIILPTVVLLILTWLGRNMIFDRPAVFESTKNDNPRLSTSYKSSNTNENLESDESSKEEELLTYRRFCSWFSGGTKQSPKPNYKTTRRHFSDEYEDEKEPLLREEIKETRAAQFEFEGRAKNYGTYVSSSLPDESDYEESTSFTIKPADQSGNKSQKRKGQKLKSANGAKSEANGYAHESMEVANIKVTERRAKKRSAGGNSIVATISRGTIGEDGVVDVSETALDISSEAQSTSNKDKESDSKERNLAEGLQQVGSVASGIGAVAQGAGGVAKALGGANTTVSTVGGVASGVGGVVGGVGNVTKGASTLIQTFGSSSKKKDKRSKVSGGLEGAGSIASGIGGAAAGVGSLVQAVGGSNSTVSTVGGVMSGAGGVIGGVGQTAQGIGSLTKTFRSSKQNKDGVSGEGGKTDRLAEGLKGAGAVVSGVGGIAQGVGGVVSAVGGNNSTVSQIGGIAGGVGGAVDGIGTAATGIGGLLKKRPKGEGKDENTLSEKIEAAGNVASGAGKAAKGIGQATEALGGDASMMNAIGDTAGGAGGFLSGIASAVKGFLGLKKSKGKASKAQTEGGPTEGKQTESDPMEGAQAEGGPLEGAQTEGGPLEGAQTEGGPLEGAQTEGGPLEGAQTEGGPLEGAQTEGGPLEGAQTEGGPLEGAQTEGGPLEGAQTEGGPLEGAQTEGGPLEGAQTEGGPLEGAQTEGGPLEGAQTEGGPLEGAQTEGGPLEGAQTEGGPLEGTQTEAGPLEGDQTEISSLDEAQAEVGLSEGEQTEDGPHEALAKDNSTVSTIDEPESETGGSFDGTGKTSKNLPQKEEKQDDQARVKENGYMERDFGEFPSGSGATAAHTVIEIDTATSAAAKPVSVNTEDSGRLSKLESIEEESSHSNEKEESEDHSIPLESKEASDLEENEASEIGEIAKVDSPVQDPTTNVAVDLPATEAVDRSGRQIPADFSTRMELTDIEDKDNDIPLNMEQ